MTVDELAQEIRRVDGENLLGAGALAEALYAFLEKRHIATVLSADPFDERNGIYFSNSDLEKLGAIKPGTKLYI